MIFFHKPGRETYSFFFFFTWPYTLYLWFIWMVKRVANYRLSFKRTKMSKVIDLKPVKSANQRGGTVTDCPIKSSLSRNRWFSKNTNTQQISSIWMWEQTLCSLRLIFYIFGPEFHNFGEEETVFFLHFYREKAKNVGSSKARFEGKRRAGCCDRSFLEETLSEGKIFGQGKHHRKLE